MTSLILGLLKHLQHKRRVLGVAVLAVLVSMSEAISLGLVVPFLALLANPNSLSEHLDRLRLPLPDVVSFSLDSLAVVSAAFVAAIAMAAILRVALAWYQNRVSVLIGVDLSARIFERNLRKPYVDQISRHTSELMAVIGKAEALPNTLINPILTILSSSFVLVTLFAVVVMANPHVALSVVGSLTLFYFLVTALTKRRVFTNGLIIARQLASVGKAILEGSTDTRSVIVGQRQYFFARAYRLASLALQYAEVSNRVTATVPRFLVEAVSIAVIVITANILLQTNTRNDLVIPLLGAVALFAQRALPMVQAIYLANVSIRGAQASLKDVLVELQGLPEETCHCPFDSNIEDVTFSSRVALENVSFAYPGGRANVLDSFNLTIEKGQFIGLIGSSGEGKSTVVDLLLGLLSPQGGALRVDGQELVTHRQIKNWQKLVSFVPQSIQLTSATIAENIACTESVESIDRGRVWRSLKGAGAYEFVSKLPLGIDSMLVEHGGNLSGGQRQRLGIARALYSDPAFLLLDEATSALDDRAEAAIIDTLLSLRPHVTILFITHRRAPLGFCDSIAELQGGCIARFGSYSDFFGSAPD